MIELADLVGAMLSGYMEMPDGSIELTFERPIDAGDVKVMFEAVVSIPHGGAEHDDLVTEVQFTVREDS